MDIDQRACRCPVRQEAFNLLIAKEVKAFKGCAISLVEVDAMGYRLHELLVPPLRVFVIFDNGKHVIDEGLYIRICIRRLCVGCDAEGCQDEETQFHFFRKKS
jgi:hypothetical protein